MKKVIMFALLALIAVTVLGEWAPIEDYRELSYVSYKITYDDYGEMKAMIVEMSITKKEDGYTLTTSNTWDQNMDDPIDMSTMFGQSMGFLFMGMLNPMYSFLYESFDLEELIPTRIMGFGTIKYEGTEVVGKYEGTKVILYDENKEPSMSWVINKDVPIALKTETIQDSPMIIELIDYKLAD